MIYYNASFHESISLFVSIYMSHCGILQIANMDGAYFSDDAPRAPVDVVPVVAAPEPEPEAPLVDVGEAEAKLKEAMKRKADYEEHVRILQEEIAAAGFDKKQSKLVRHLAHRCFQRELLTLFTTG